MKDIIDSRNKLNDLSGKEWIQLSRSWWYQKGLGKNHKETRIEIQHPAPFSFQDIQKLIRQLTKPGMTVLDPFCGISSTLKAAALCGRNAIGIEISPKWVKLGKERLIKEIPKANRNSVKLKIIRGDCLKILPSIQSKSIDFIITSPPYWKILNKDPDYKIKAFRLKKKLATRYSRSPSDLGNIEEYDEFLNSLLLIIKECRRVLRKGSYMSIIVSDFRNGSQFYPFHMDVVNLGKKAKLSLKGILILIQNDKSLFPYGYPYAFVQNIHHQYSIILQK
jgi:DNA modification methylase